MDETLGIQQHAESQGKSETFASLGKHTAIKKLFEGTSYSPFGESSFEVKPRTRIFSATKVMLEGVDFDLVYFPLKHLGYKLVTAVTAELYASLAKPAVLEVSLVLSSKLDFEQTKEIWAGVVSAANEHSYAQVRLELQPSINGLGLFASAFGEISELTARRCPKPQSKDLLCVSGPLGAAYMGFSLLSREKVRFEKGSSPGSGALEKYKMLVGAYLKPELSAHIVQNITETEMYPSCGVCVDKGLADAVLRISQRTGLGAKVYTERLPFEGGTFALGEELDIDPISAAMNGGDDFRLLFAIPILQAEKFRKDFQTFDIIGHLALPEAGCCLVTPEGAELPLKAQGYQNGEEEQ